MSGFGPYGRVRISYAKTVSFFCQNQLLRAINRLSRMLPVISGGRIVQYVISRVFVFRVCPNYPVIKRSLKYRIETGHLFCFESNADLYIPYDRRNRNVSFGRTGSNVNYHMKMIRHYYVIRNLSKRKNDRNRDNCIINKTSDIGQMHVNRRLTATRLPVTGSLYDTRKNLLFIISTNSNKIAPRARIIVVFPPRIAPFRQIIVHFFTFDVNVASNHNIRLSFVAGRT